MIFLKIFLSQVSVEQGVKSLHENFFEEERGFLAISAIK
jgi:hypothetical protein